MKPDLSVVIVASWSADAVEATVASLGESGVEIVVVSDPDRVAPRPGVRWIVGNPGDGVPTLRRLGAEATTGSVVAFLEDACVVGPGWVRAIREGFDDPQTLAATGPIQADSDSSETDWAVYFAEYVSFAAGPAKRLAGLNFACRRSALGPSGPIREHELTARLPRPTWTGQAGVRHVRRYTWEEALRDRGRFGREYGEERWGDRPGWPTLLGPLAASAILGSQLARLAHSLVRSPRLIPPCVRSGASTLALLKAWSRGEAAGWAAARRLGSRRCGTEAPPPASQPVRVG